MANLEFSTVHHSVTSPPQQTINQRAHTNPNQKQKRGKEKKK
jgi:hypothetical protein